MENVAENKQLQIMGKLQTRHSEYIPPQEAVLKFAIFEIFQIEQMWNHTEHWVPSEENIPAILEAGDVLEMNF